MLTWTELVDHVRRNARATVLAPNAVLLPAAGNQVAIDRIEAAGTPALPCARLSVRIHPEALTDARAMLRAAAALTIGSIAIDGGYYVVRHVLPLSWTDERQIDQVAQYLARLAGALRDHLQSAPERAAVCFANYAA
jgi:hypothetical protein